MKFQKRIEDELVPEWKGKYVQYKYLKKILKDIDGSQCGQNEANDVLVEFLDNGRVKIKPRRRRSIITQTKLPKKEDDPTLFSLGDLSSHSIMNTISDISTLLPASSGSSTNITYIGTETADSNLDTVEERNSNQESNFSSSKDSGSSGRCLESLENQAVVREMPRTMSIDDPKNVEIVVVSAASRVAASKKFADGHSKQSSTFKDSSSGGSMDELFKPIPVAAESGDSDCNTDSSSLNLELVEILNPVFNNTMTDSEMTSCNTEIGGEMSHTEDISLSLDSTVSNSIIQDCRSDGAYPDTVPDLVQTPLQYLSQDPASQIPTLQISSSEIVPHNVSKDSTHPLLFEPDESDEMIAFEPEKAKSYKSVQSVGFFEKVSSFGSEKGLPSERKSSTLKNLWSGSSPNLKGLTRSWMSLRNFKLSTASSNTAISMQTQHSSYTNLNSPKKSNFSFSTLKNLHTKGSEGSWNNRPNSPLDKIRSLSSFKSPRQSKELIPVIACQWWDLGAETWINGPDEAENVHLRTQVPENLVHQNMENLFFPALDNELNKANDFFKNQELEVTKRTEALKQQVKYLMGLPSKPRKKIKILRIAVREHYRGLMMLENYAVLNTTAVAKILKKHDKRSNWVSKPEYMNSVERMSIYTGIQRIQTLQRQSEELAVDLAPPGKFGKVNPQHLLRPPKRKDSPPLLFLTLGVFLGMSIIIAFWMMSSLSHHLMQAWGSGLSHLSPCLSPPLVITLLLAFHISLFGLDAFVWDHFRVNHIFIFNMSYASAPTSTAVTLSGVTVMFLLGLMSFITSALDVTAAVNLTFVMFVGLLISTVANNHVSEMGYMRFCVNTYKRVITAPLFSVRFQDFFMGDQLCSQSFLLQQSVMLLCFLHGIGSRWDEARGGGGGGEWRFTQCHTCSAFYGTRVAVYIVSLMPYWFRLAQCLRRLGDERKMRAHLWWFRRWEHVFNAGKYSSSILAGVIAIYYHENPSDTFFFLKVFFKGVTFAYSLAWDLVMDWGLLRCKSKNPYLRDELVLPWKPVYYFSMCLNTLLRLTWVLSLVPVMEDDLKGHSYTVLFALLEIVRRCHWNFYRVENEHLNNCDMFRATKLIPLPFSIADE